MSNRRDTLRQWVFQEMRTGLRQTANILVELPRSENGEAKASPPFELPYSLDIPSINRDRWLSYLDLLDQSELIAALIQGGNPSQKETSVLNGIKLIDDRRRQIIHDIFGTENPDEDDEERSLEEQMLQLIEQKRDGAINFFHESVSAGDTNLRELFEDERFADILGFLKTGTSASGVGKLIVPGNPDASVFYQKITDGGMKSFFDQDNEVPIVKAWIEELGNQA